MKRITKEERRAQALQEKLNEARGHITFALNVLRGLVGECKNVESIVVLDLVERSAKLDKDLLRLFSAIGMDRG